jgi:hypothetical protein
MEVIMKNKSAKIKAVGTPTMLLLPARNYKFFVYDEQYSIVIPRKGVYTDFDEKLFSTKDGEFSVLAELDEENVLYMPSISKVLFAAHKYPDLKDNQAFTPTAIIFREDEVEIIGQIIEMIKEDD